jgi:hypothetical protein
LEKKYFPTKGIFSESLNSKIKTISGGKYCTTILTTNGIIYSSGKIKYNDLDIFLTNSQIFTKINFFNAIFSQIFNLKFFELQFFVTYKGDIVKLGELNNEGLENYVKEPVFAEWKCYGNIFYNSACGTNGDCNENDVCVCKQNFIGDLCEYNIWILITIGFLGAFILVLLILGCVISLIVCVLFGLIIGYLNLKFKKYRKKIEIEKKLLGEKKVNFNNIIDFKDDDFKIPFKEIKDMEEIGEGLFKIKKLKFSK